jgi:gliding motility-associated-like protein
MSIENKRHTIRITYSTTSGPCTPTTSSGSSYYITNFTTTGGTTNINNNSGSSTSGYQDFYNTVSMSATAGATINYSITCSSGTYGRAIWVDWNENGTFEASEQMVSSSSYESSPLTGSFTIPAGTSSGTKRMRILASWTPSNPSDPCNNSGSGEYEDYKIIVSGGGPTPTHCVPTTSGGSTYYITNFTTTGGTTNINNSSGSSASGYQDFYNTVSMSANTGATINYSISCSSSGSTYGRAIWIDWNENGVFEASEQVVSSGSYASSPLTGSFSIPTGVSSGTKRMRILASYTPSNPSNPCSNSGSGEYEDYKIIIQAIEMKVPAAGNNSYTTCSGHLYDNGGASGNYANSSNGYTVLYPGTTGQTVQVSGTITCEGGYDYLTIYNGVGTGGTVLWGGSAHGSGTGCATFTVPAITSTTGPLTVKFNSDASNNCAGFDLTISCVPAQGTGEDCTSSIAFCTEDNYLFPASTNVTGYGQVGCLYSTPNPAWYYMQVGNPGDIIISISSGYDVDFIAWGPYTSVDTYCSEITMGPCTPTSCPNNTSDPSFYPYGDIVDCSYDAASSETVHILGAQTGQVYALLITNYSNEVTNISFQQTSGSGTADCSIVAPPISSNSVVCVGNTLELYVTYSQPGATYQWTGPNGWTSNQMNPTRPNATTAMSGTYSMVVTIGGLTSDPVTTQVTVAPNVTPTFNAVGPYCQGASIPALPTTSTNGITGTWSPAINNNATTTYTFTPNAGQCASTTTMQIVVNPLPSPSINPNPATICAGGSIQLTASGGATYNWSNSSTSPSINVSPASTTTYTVTVTSAEGCTASASRQVTVNPLPTVAATVDCGLGVGQGVINVTSPTGANYQYSLNGGSFQSSPSFGNLANGSYTVVATNTTTTCSSPESIVVVDCGCANPPTVTLATTSGEICGISSPFTLGGNTFGGSATAVTLSHNGGGNLNITSATSSPFSFTYTPAASDLGNTVTIIVTTNNPIGLPCTVEQKTLSLNVLTLPTVVVGYNPPVCETGTLILSETGGAAINWSWNGPNGFISTSQNPQINNATAAANGTYSVTVTDGNTCTNTGSVLVSISPNPVASATFAPIACNGGTTVVTVSASGGTGSYVGTGSYTVSAGPYSYTVTDSNGCSSTTSVNIADPTVLTSSINAQTNQICSTPGSATVLGSGGTPSYTYQWSSGAGGVSGGTASILPAGTYYVTVRDANSCSTVQTVTIIDEGAISATATVNSNVSCNGGNNGSINVSITTGTPPFNINWGSGSAITSSSTYQITGLVAGPYTITISDANSCEIVRNATITEPLLLQASSSAAAISCYGDTTTVIVSASGGMGPYTGTGSFTVNAGTYYYTVTDANACSATTQITVNQPNMLEVTASTNKHVSCNGFTDGQATASATGGTPSYTYNWNDPNSSSGSTVTQLPAGTWTVLVTDSNGCTATNSVTVTEPLVLSVDINVNDVLCFGGSTGSLIATVTGGSNPYYYLWSSGGQTSSIITNLSAGVYTLTVTDARDCQIIASAVVNQPQELEVFLTSNPATCGSTGGSVLASVVGGSPDYQYMWSVSGSQNNIQNLSPGTYSLTVKDLNMCTKTQSIDVGTVGSINAEINVLSDISCYGKQDGAIQATSSNGKTPLSFEWNTGLASSVITNIGGGSYDVTITDAWGCIGNANYVMVEPTEIVINANVQGISCYGLADGAVSTQVSGGTQPYNYMWSNLATSAGISNLFAGSYSVTVSDLYGCQQIQTYELTQPDNLIINVDVKNIICYNNNDGAVKIAAVGGTQPYSYGLNISGSLYPGQIHTTLGAGVYVAYVRDANSCIDTTLVMITSPAPLEVSYVFENPSCKGARNGSIEIAVAGGVEPYLFETNNVIIDIPLFVGLSAGRYDVIITDANNCSFELDGIVLSESNKDCIRIPDAFTPNGDGINDTWIIENIKMFPSATIFVYNRWGQEVWVGNPGEEWDGKRNSKLMPAGTYLYLVELYDGSKPYTGTVTLVY